MKGAETETGVGPTSCDDCLVATQMYGLAKPEQCGIVLGAMLAMILIPMTMCLLWRCGLLHLCCFCCKGSDVNHGTTIVVERHGRGKGRGRREDRRSSKTSPRHGTGEEGGCSMELKNVRTGSAQAFAPSGIEMGVARQI